MGNMSELDAWPRIDVRYEFQILGNKDQYG